ncbi:ABC transporter substrate-binding protein [Demequina litorisediminis]|uniref:Fe/B12 periplasmic-binding domain-containing protein n=1 Tax=Demequina litorisediminis TaxID=1849022 RepID=A0ABQ6IJA1_9MICO|nr:hypothetical protein GCM10025876_30020 [Demequina litorisediminis]
MAKTRLLTAGATVAALAALTACSGGADEPTASASASATTAATATANADGSVTIEHAFGTTTIEGTPENVATVQWANHEVPLSLGVVPVGMAKANFGGSDVLPWVDEALTELGGEPVLFDETDGIDFEAVANTDPDVILAAYSGISQEDYDTLSAIAPTVAFPTEAWATTWRDMITYNAMGMNKACRGGGAHRRPRGADGGCHGRISRARGQDRHVHDARRHGRPVDRELLHDQRSPRCILRGPWPWRSCRR